MSLPELLHVSHVLGCNPGLIQAGGGNTSVKCDRSMYIKASGTALSRMTPGEGWVLVDMEKIRGLYDRPELENLADDEREREVLKVLYDSVIEPSDARPSVETPLHVMLDRVVMHSHPVVGNTLACHPSGEEILWGLWPDALWVPYIDPGSTLAFGVADKVGQYSDENGSPPSVMLLQNHGLFVSAPSPTECVLLMQNFLARVERFFTERRVAGIEESLRTEITTILKRAMGGDACIRFSQRDSLVRAAQSEHSRIFEDSLTPDHVVYAGPRALVIDSVGSLEEGLSSFRDSFGSYPRLILLRGQGFVVVGDSASKVDAAEEMAEAAAEISFLGGGEYQFLDERSASFIINWEAEHYRAKLME